jgi:Helix-turn-helix domain
MARFRRLLEDNPDCAINVPEICAAVGVPERALWNCRHERQSLGPTQYPSLRRMHLPHQALRVAAPNVTTGTKVAAHFGFWQFGRCTVNYRRQSGESPSVTLSRPPQ